MAIVRKRSKKPAQQIKIAKERIRILFAQAENELNRHPDRSRRYVQLARKIGLRYNVRLPRQLKRSFCKNCNSLLRPGLTASVSINSKKRVIIIKCLRCNKIYRYPYKG